MPTIHGGLVSALAILLAATIAAPAMAAPVVIPDPTTTGKVGPHHLDDTEDHPGARCSYPETPNHLYRVHVVPPVARARAGRSSQRIGFRYVIKGWNGTRLENVVISSFQIRIATHSDEADFTDRTAPIDDLTDHHGYYLVRVDLRWYDSAGKVVGKTSDYVSHYTTHWIGVPPDYATGFCGDTTG